MSSGHGKAPSSQSRETRTSVCPLLYCATVNSHLVTLNDPK
ncbi:hypothetical protein ALP99_100975 [Pseudomonas syringae pv. tomato]|uniref:Uncharacterized protein n=8 Tax=Pseudomonas syringae group TaxID=136849 RepID=A0A0N0WTR2_PSEYM|nr:Unknown protein sequence [Pseudomonas syringae pv. maculicola]KPB89852.1 Unknown protein sequence [Pseudomonas syringae pv. maculicola str. M6]KPC05302.1 Unknown protein sequence [Pseudomonas amygdali pv. lachrymans]KPW33365.1 hypothetical protein ALO87_100954 [Pseudomonas syringae pv. apii]KPW51970.1 hypothetical protein ALO88_100993 [Pseudomonas syringae pv. antirrhini]KPW55778.1 hypothetical protein ALO86_100769 [Pseudomonas syringae pv. berberidis]KPY26019.1 hypothetical protein ALO54_